MSEFEDHTRETFDASIAQLNGRVRSRLTQARHAALGELAVRRHGGVWSRWRARLQLRTLAPAGALAAVALLAVVLWTGRDPSSGVSIADAGNQLEDIELLADNDALDISADGDYEFYEWAAAQDDAGQPVQGT